MITLLAAALAALSGCTYWLIQGSWQMPYWLMAVSVIGSTALAQAFEDWRGRRRVRAGRVRRAHARPSRSEGAP